ncbi:MAG TPA: AAC(3) family N-acetyltransferase, partial [Ilumatobacteraceae bacterium]|nr:AAC(3) family N-acetyltransferase [Ilumatobacteraceae bacterium]
MSEAVSATDEPWAGEAAAIARTDAPVTRAAVVGALRAVGVQPAGLIIVHSSLSRLGWVVGGAHTVVSALAEAVTPDGTIVMPSLSSNLGEPSRWEAPPVPASWW